MNILGTSLQQISDTLGLTKRSRSEQPPKSDTTAKVTHRLLQEIGSYLGVRDSASMALVSKRMREVPFYRNENAIASEYLHRAISKVAQNPKRPVIQILIPEKIRQLVTRLHITLPLNSGPLSQIGTLFPNLQSLTLLSTIPFKAKPNICPIASTCSFEEGDLNKSSHLTHFYTFENFPQLKKLDIPNLFVTKDNEIFGIDAPHSGSCNQNFNPPLDLLHSNRDRSTHFITLCPSLESVTVRNAKDEQIDLLAQDPKPKVLQLKYTCGRFPKTS